MAAPIAERLWDMATVDTEQIEKARRERFETVARQYMGKFPTLYDLEQPFKFGPDGDEYMEEPIQFAWEMWREAGQGERREWYDAAKLLIDYCEDHNWGTMPEPFDSIKPLLKLLEREAAGRIQTTPHKEQL